MQKIIAATVFGSLLSACSAADTPSGPPELTPPPEVATTGFLAAYTAQTIALSVPELRQFIDDQPLINFLEPTENISNPIETKVVLGRWPDPGATRWVKLADGHYVVERVIENEPDFFKYQIYIFTNATGRGVAQIVGEQRFVPVDGGTEFQWTYNVLPKNFITRQVVRGSMDEVQEYIEGGLSRFAATANQ